MARKEKAKRSANKDPRFRLSRTRSAVSEFKGVPPVLRPSVQKRLLRLQSEGCRAADYALSGPEPWPRLCSIHVDGWRIVVAFPAADEVAVVKVAPHDSSSDPYRGIAAALGIEVSGAPRTKPKCCPDGTPPVDPGLVDRMEAAFARLTAADRRR